MPYLTASIILTTLFYIVAAYMSYVTASVLHKGVAFRLAVPIIKSVIFIALCYISIISDVFLFADSLYKAVTIKNGLLLLLVVASLYTAKNRKGDKT